MAGESGNVRAARPLAKLSLRIDQLRRDNDYHWFVLPVFYGGGVVLWLAPRRVEGLATQAEALLLSGRPHGYEGLVQAVQSGDVGQGQVVVGPEGSVIFITNMSRLFDCFE